MIIAVAHTADERRQTYQHDLGGRQGISDKNQRYSDGYMYQQYLDGITCREENGLSNIRQFRSVTGITNPAIKALLKGAEEVSTTSQKHYKNTSLQHTWIFHGCKNENFQFLHIFAQNIDRGYTLEPPQ